MEATLLGQGFSLMLYGMGLVFMFLAILVVVTNAMSAIVEKYFPEGDGEEPERLSGRQTGSSIEPRLVTIIEAAIAQHRDKKHN